MSQSKWPWKSREFERWRNKRGKYQRLCIFSASEAGHQAEADGSVRPSEECGPSPNWAMDAGQSLQRQCLCVEPRNAGVIPLKLRQKTQINTNYPLFNLLLYSPKRTWQTQERSEEFAANNFINGLIFFPPDTRQDLRSMWPPRQSL